MVFVLRGTETGRVYFVENRKSELLCQLIEKYPNPQYLPESMRILRYLGEWSDKVKQAVMEEYVS